MTIALLIAIAAIVLGIWWWTRQPRPPSPREIARQVEQSQAENPDRNTYFTDGPADNPNTGIFAAALAEQARRIEDQRKWKVDPRAASEPLQSQRVPVPSRVIESASVGPLTVSFTARPPVSEMSIDQFHTMALESIEIGDWDTARYWLQKIAYGMVKPEVSPAEKARFTAFMTEFAARDPLYHALMDRARALISQHPGTMQSDFTRGRGEHDAQAIRYVFYFAEQLGELVRVPKGNSYRLFLPGQDTSVATAHSRKKKTTSAVNSTSPPVVLPAPPTPPPDSEPISPEQLMEHLWWLHDVFRPQLSRICTLPYEADFEAEADEALGQLGQDENTASWEHCTPGAWRVLLERHLQMMVVAAANWAAGEPVITYVPRGLSTADKRIGLALRFLPGMKLPWPPSDRSSFVFPESKQGWRNAPR